MVGDTKMSAVPNDHLGWLKCTNNRALSVSEYYQLWRVIGYSFGGSNDIFYLPSAEGRVPGFAGTGNDINNSTITFTFGSTPGEYSHTLTVPELAEHDHTGTTSSNGSHSHTHNANVTSNVGYGLMYVNGANTAAGGLDSSAGEPNLYQTPISLSINSNGDHAHTVYNDGSNVAHNNIQPTIVIGNLFIYSGKLNTPRSGFPYTENTVIL